MEEGEEALLLLVIPFEEIDLRRMRFNFSLLFVETSNSSERSNDRNVCNRYISIIFTGVKGDDEEVGDADPNTLAVEMLEVGDETRASACEIVLVKADLRELSTVMHKERRGFIEHEPVSLLSCIIYVEIKNSRANTHRTDSASLVTLRFMFPGSAEMIFAYVSEFV